MAKASLEQLALINKMSHKELTQDDVFVFADRMIDNQVTSYASTLHPNLLRKFVKDASKGVGLLMSHDSNRLPVGRSFNARLQEEFDPELNDMVTSVYGDFYIDLGRNTESQMTTDDIAQGIESGTIFDTSIGFTAEKWDCSVCGNDIRSWNECSHLPGRKYVVQRENEDGEIVDVVETCLVLVGADGNGELLENSLVYAGACDRATIVGQYSVNQGSDIENSTKLHLVDSLKNVPIGATVYQFMSKNGLLLFSSKLGVEEPLKQTPELNGEGELRKGSDDSVELTQLTEVLGQFGIKAETPDVLSASLTELSKAQTELAELSVKHEEMATELADKVTENEQLTAKLATNEEAITELTAQNEELTQKAEVAETYRQDLCSQVLDAGVRAQGNAFNKGMYSKFLETLSIGEIKEVLEGFNSEVETRFAGAKTTATKEPIKNKLNNAPTNRADFDTDEEFRAYVADKAVSYSKENNLSIKEATKQLYTKFTTNENGGE